MRINVPNQITLGRLMLALVFFALLSFYSPVETGRQWILSACFWIFLIAALTDIVDGWLARTWQQVTSFGRICDPVVDKVMVCGAFVFFASGLFYGPDPQSPERLTNITGVQPWMVVVILLRELLVSAIRSFSEAQGDSFAATWVGKLKMFIQAATVCVVLGVLAWYPESLAWLRITAVWLTVVATGLSIIAYASRARAFVLSASALGSQPEPIDTQAGTAPSAPTERPAPPPSAATKPNSKGASN
jgi:CDP-diacylglycerol--glycerol-3-phosphate 3-phosphatidyltransferase